MEANERINEFEEYAKQHRAYCKRLFSLSDIALKLVIDGLRDTDISSLSISDKCRLIESLGKLSKSVFESQAATFGIDEILTRYSPEYREKLEQENIKESDSEIRRLADIAAVEFFNQDEEL